MPSHTASHELPYPLEGESADVPRDIKALAEKADSSLDAIAPKQITGVAKKQLLIANASGVVTAVTASGDVTNDESGVFSIGAGKVGESKLANDAVTAAKIAENAVGSSEIAPGAVGASEIADGSVGESELADGAVTSQKAKLTMGVAAASEDKALASLSFEDVPGAKLEITPAVASYLKVTIVATRNGSAVGGLFASVKLDAEAEQAACACIPSTLESLTYVSATQVYLLSLAKGTKHTIQMRAKKQGEKSACTLAATHTRMFWELFAA